MGSQESNELGAAERSGDGVKTCAIGLTSITTWAECKSQNALANAVPVQYEFNNNDWPYGCLIISGKLFFNGKLDSAATQAGTSGQRLLCKLTSESECKANTGYKFWQSGTEKGCPKATLTFHPHPSTITLPSSPFYLLTFMSPQAMWCLPGHKDGVAGCECRCFVEAMSYPSGNSCVNKVNTCYDTPISESIAVPWIGFSLICP